MQVNSIAGSIIKFNLGDSFVFGRTYTDQVSAAETESFMFATTDDCASSSCYHGGDVSD